MPQPTQRKTEKSAKTRSFAEDGVEIIVLSFKLERSSGGGVEAFGMEGWKEGKTFTVRSPGRSG